MIRTLWAVYEKPREFPYHYLVQEWAVVKGGAMEPVDAPRVFCSVEDAQEWLRDRGLLRFARRPHDNPSILETWI